MNKHTPGPWRYLRSGYGSKSADFDIVTDSGGRVASTPYEDKARLIAAAPELLNLVAALRDYISDIPESSVGGDDYAVSLCRKASAAIAKAEGKS